ncbi:uncharacterized protein GGS25DRAFT_244086 [Hypoxylon fragiforme]|uniref:uncharacterized protein n=1 Tax=Hypoxylon fragiforme TaxID=63214 RepID=UPI0020C69A26|nr:uncharacterized protein GGS25DRAFT_244086 [Hypoxylon fragiforme]KAI2610054.1 hypothetical protein GGS25DRAFT_244086 [Hypoxylon fragiforme]
MAYRFPKSISAARVAAFVKTAAWIQGTSASEAYLPEDALNNFLRRHGIDNRQAPPPPPPPAPEEDDDDEEEEEKESVEGEEKEEDENSSANEEGDDSSLSSDESLGTSPSESSQDSAEEDPANGSNSAQAGIAIGASGQPAIGSAEPTPLSMGAKVAIGVWSAVAVFAVFGLIYFFCRRRRRARMAQAEMNALRDEELARSRQGMSEMGGPLPPAPGSVIDPLSPAHLRGGGGGDEDTREPTVRNPSGQWMPTPPWQEDPPTWRDSHPWGQSQPSVTMPMHNGLPSGPKPLFAKQQQGGLDARTEGGETETTIFAYR